MMYLYGLLQIQVLMNEIIMKTKPCIYSQPNYLTRIAIEAEIIFAVSSMAELIVVYFYIIMISKYWQSAAQSCLRLFELRVLPFGKTSRTKLLNLLNNPTDRAFENRWSRYKERKIK